MKVEIMDFPAIRVAALRHLGAYDQIGTAFGRLGAIADQAGLLIDPSVQMLAIYHDDPSTTDVNALRSDAALTVSAAGIPGELTEQTVPGGRYACAVYRGPYTGLPAAWAQLMSEDIPATGERFADGPSIEVYLNNPMTTEKPDLLTEIRIPLRI
ncbi:MAG: GyrI-like domain-containing protein [Gemmatimonadaceae bacterium]|nr:GyrI-like domain-containing protein [Gemmatimonadaceae bacterium]MBA3657852.1 GyrI-like domain-containing protein [Gemmatimonadaceae bacterium]